MHKYTKWALVLLYLLQLVVVFREQLVHLYKSAIQSVHGQTGTVAHHGRSGTLGTAAADLVNRAFTLTRPISHTSFSALAVALIPPATVHHEGKEKHEEHPHPAHSSDGDENKDRARKQRRRLFREYLIHDFWHSIRVSVARAERSEPCTEISRVLTFA